jgi:hypothetical protein
MVSVMPKYSYIYFGPDIPKKIEAEYNKMCRYEQYLMERGIAHNLISYDNDYFLLQIADRTSSEEYIREVQADILWQKRLDLIPASLDWLRFKSPEEYTLIYEYYFLLSEDRAKLHILSQKYGVSMMAISRRLAKTRSKLKDFILSHENDW